MKKFIAFFSIMAFLSGHLRAQDNCRNAVFESDKLYEAGKITELIQNLEPCLENLKNKEEKFEACRLLALAYHETQNIEKSSFYMKAMLKLKPTYQQFPMVDPISFSQKLNQFRVEPKLYLGLEGAPSLGYTILVESYSALPSTQYYAPSLGWNSGLSLHIKTGANTRVSAAIKAQRIAVKHIMELSSNETLTMTETLKFATSQALFHYPFQPTEKIAVSLGTGLGLSYLWQAITLLETLNPGTGEIAQASKLSTDERNRLQPFFITQVNLEYPVGLGHIGFSPSWQIFLRTSVNPQERLSQPEFIFSNGYVSDDIRLRAINFTISYRHPIVFSVKPAKP